ncbi:MAG: hypothetical protein IPK35_15500 [Saprospiraceae bacterium]|jgi:hypothetical protein|nr:hypothetical protein [Saprospiraceae bacterium]
MNAIIKNIIWLWIILILAASCSKTEETEPEATKFSEKTVIGAWKGVSIQSGYDPSPFTLSIEKIEVGKKCGEIDNLGQCDYDYIFKEKLGESLIFREELKSSAINPNCINGTSVLSIINQDKLKYDWVGDDHPRNTASATLIRVK